jgi:hypothetical protein
MTGRRTGLATTARKALRALSTGKIPHCVVGATALAARGLPRMTADLDVAVLIDDAPQAWAALRAAGFEAATPTGSEEDPESMVVFALPGSKIDVDLLVAAGDPEASAIDEAELATLFGIEAPVATLEYLLLLYLYSNQPKHLGDFASIVQSERADLTRAERALALMHPEMLSEWRKRVDYAKNPPPPPKKPVARRRRPRT